MALKHRTSKGLAAVSVAVASAFALSACGNDTAGPETGVDVEDVEDEAVDPYDGPYDTAFYEDVTSYANQQVTVSADVNEVLSDTAFTIAGTEDTAVEPLLVVGATEISGLEPGVTVSVTGTVHEAFDMVAVEEQVGIDLEDQLYEDFEGDPLIVATNVDTTVPADEE